MIFGGLQKVSTIDFPGNLSCVAFVRGCDLDCFYCHNRELLSPGEGELTSGEVLDFLRRRQGLLDGIVVSGGEPTLYSDLTDFLKQVKALGFQVKLDTNGQHPKVVQALMQQRLVDYVAVDWKALPQHCLEVTGREDAWEKARQTILLLMDEKTAFEARTTLYPGLTRGELLELASLLPPLPRYRINFFHQPPEFRPEDQQRLELPCLSKKDLAAIETAIRSFQPGLIWQQD